MSAALSVNTTLEERVILNNPNGRIGVTESEFSCALQVDNEIVGAYWHDCEGSVGQCVWLSEIDCIQKIATWKSIINYGDIQKGTLSEIFQPVTNSLVSGTYDLILDDEEFEWEITLPSEKNKRKNGYYEEVYPWDAQIISTLPSSQIDFSRIEYFQNIIKNHGRPIAITISNRNNYCSYILDGHHKFEAYKREKKFPRILFIECISSNVNINIENAISNDAVQRDFMRRNRIYDRENNV